MVNLVVRYYDEEFPIAVKFKNVENRLVAPREIRSKIVEKLKQVKKITRNLLQETVFCYYEEDGDLRLCESKMEQECDRKGKLWKRKYLHVPTDKLQIFFAEAWSIEEYENQVQRLEKAGKARVQGGLDNIVLNMLR